MRQLPRRPSPRRGGAGGGGLLPVRLLATQLRHLLGRSAGTVAQAHRALLARMPRGLWLRDASQAGLLPRAGPLAPRSSWPREPRLPHARRGHVSPGPSPDLVHPLVHVRAAIRPAPMHGCANLERTEVSVDPLGRMVPRPQYRPVAPRALLDGHRSSQRGSTSGRLHSLCTPSAVRAPEGRSKGSPPEQRREDAMSYTQDAQGSGLPHGGFSPCPERNPKAVICGTDSLCRGRQ
jgi:hypothetical protein